MSRSKEHFFFLGKELNLGGSWKGYKEEMGLTVESIQAGDGKHYPMKLQTVTLHYVGYLDRAGEKQFDSTFERGIFT